MTVSKRDLMEENELLRKFIASINKIDPWMKFAQSEIEGASKARIEAERAKFTDEMRQTEIK